MWKQLGDLIWRVLKLTEDINNNRSSINVLRTDVDRLSVVQDQEGREWRAAVERLAYEIKRTAEHERHEREQPALQLKLKY